MTCFTGCYHDILYTAAFAPLRRQCKGCPGDKWGDSRTPEKSWSLMLTSRPHFKTNFSLSEDAIRSTAIIRPSIAEMLRFIVEQDEGWLESWVLKATQRTGTSPD